MARRKRVVIVLMVALTGTLSAVCIWLFSPASRELSEGIFDLRFSIFD